MERKKCYVRNVYGAEISDSSDINLDATTVVEWTVAATATDDEAIKLFEWEDKLQVGQKVDLEGICVWWWKEGLMIEAVNYGKIMEDGKR